MNRRRDVPPVPPDLGAPGWLLAAVLFLGIGTTAYAQPVPEALAAQCSDGAPAALQTSCADAALALNALHGGVGLLVSAGGPLPAGPSTAGLRAGQSPRLVFDLGAVLSSFRHPVLSGGSPGEVDRRSSVLGGRFTVVAGLFDGFQPLPTVGGLLSVDAVAAVQLVRAPGSPASPGSRVGWGGGVRLGAFRESFSLPGITLSAMHHRVGELKYGSPTDPGGLAAVEPTVTSLRVIVGKDLWPVGLSAGFGWDRYRGSGRIEARVADGAGGTVESVTGRRDLRLNRRYFFAGVNYTWLVTQVAAELTWAREATPALEIEGTGPFRPGDRELQGSLSFRLSY